jgi:hypothetical protein
MSNGIVRGFSRLGIGVAILVSFWGAAATMMVASDQYYKAELESGVGRIPGAIDDRSPNAIGNRMPSPMAQEPRRRSDVADVALAPSPAGVATKTSAVGLGVTALLALAAFGFFRVLGWVVTGFAKG